MFDPGEVSDSRGGFGKLRYLRPGTEVPARCPAGHRLGVAGPNNGWSHLSRRHEYCCELCLQLGSLRWSWCPVDVSEQHTEATAPRLGLALVQIPPPRWAGPGQLRLQLGQSSGPPEVLGTATLSLCPIDRRAVLQRIEITQRWRRHGAGRVLLAAAAALGTGYSWSTRLVPSDLGARAFWARVGPADWPAPPAYCSHQLARGSTAEDPET